MKTICNKQSNHNHEFSWTSVFLFFVDTVEWKLFGAFSIRIETELYSSCACVFECLNVCVFTIKPTKIKHLPSTFLTLTKNVRPIYLHQNGIVELITVVICNILLWFGYCPNMQLNVCSLISNWSVDLYKWYQCSDNFDCTSFFTHRRIVNFRQWFQFLLISALHLRHNNSK